MSAEQAEFAVVGLVFFNATGDPAGDLDDVQLQATSATWATEDMGVARTLREQLCGLLGDAVIESIMPQVTIKALDNIRKNQWPGAVQFGQADDAAD